MEHHPQHLNSLVRITPTPLVRVLQIDPSINKVVEQLSKIYSKLINQTNFKYHVIFNVKFDKEDEHVDYFINLPISNNTHPEGQCPEGHVTDTINNEIERYEGKGSGWRFNTINFFDVRFYKTKELNGSSYKKLPDYVKTQSLLNIKNSDDYCFIWSILAKLYPSTKKPRKSYTLS